MIFRGSWFWSVLTWSLLVPAGAADQRPNVLMIAVDDLGPVIGGHGYPDAITPHLDALAKSGMRFDRAYCQIPLCNPSRASILTGLRPDQTRVYDLDRHFRDQVPDAVTLPQWFRHHGWFSARVGKLFHYDVPNGIGTDGLDDPPSWERVINPKGREVTDAALITNAEPHRPISAALSWLAAEGTDEEQTDGMIATEAIRLMRERDKSRPFFLGVGFFRPHTPFVAPKKWFDRYPIEKMGIPFAPPDDRADIPSPAFAHNNVEPHYGLPLDTLRQAKQAYYASVSFVDAQIGRVLDALEALGLADQTIVVLWSDHGYHLGEHGGIWQKRTLFEESARSPLLIRAPGAAGNGRPCQRVVELVDLYPTLADLAGLPLPLGPTLSGRSLRPLLENPNAAWEGRAITQILRPGGVMGRSVRTETWRYTEWNGGDNGRELYDIRTDPFEFTNKAGTTDVDTIDTIAKLKALFDQRAEPLPPQTPVNPKRL
jgi:iduronate 2-sulfatase